MTGRHIRFHRLLRVIVAIVALALLLTACGGDDGDDKDDTQPAETPGVSDPVDGEDSESDEGVLPATVASTPAPPATQAVLPTLTPYIQPDATAFQAVGEEAAVALASEMTISLDDLEILDPDMTLYLDDPVLCPDIDPAYDDADLYFVYVQHEQSIYAYQVLQLPAAEGAVDAPEPFVQRCEDVFLDEDVQYIPEDSPKTQPVEAVKADLIARGFDPSAGRVAATNEVVWTDEALGCPLSAGVEEPAPAAIEGYRIVYALGGELYEYHTDLTGEQLVYCEPPAGYDTVQAFIDELMELVDDLDVEVLPAEEEVARYNGLAGEGVLIEMTRRADRIGVFGFDTPEAAADAAMGIDDETVSHIFVSGNVLIVQEENNMAIYSTLLNRAQEIRNVAEERLRTDRDAAAAEDAADDAEAELDGE